MTLIGSVDHYIYPTQNVMNECYVGIFNFLSSSNARTVGIKLIAYSSGSSPGTGSGYWDESKRFGNNAWSVFCFSSATVPFYVHFQYSEKPGQFGVTPGSPALIAANSNAPRGVLGWQVAFLDNGGNPWNGSSGSNIGSDVKRSPVWTSGSSTLFVFPRSNATGGLHSTLRENMTPMFAMQSNIENVSNLYNQGARFHLVADKENFLMMSSPGTQDFYLPCFFGKYSVPSNGPRNNHPYLMMCSVSNPDIKSVFNLASLFGSPNGNQKFDTGGNTTGYDGGVSFKGAVAGSGVFSYNLDVYASTFISQLQPNAFISEEPQFDVRSINVLVNDGTLRGFLGKIDFFGISQGLGTNSLSDDKCWLALGGSNDSISQTYSGYMYENFMQWVIPWDSMTQVGECFHREGRQWKR